MAIDTATKRAAVLGAGGIPGVVLPVPDGTIDAADRAHLAGIKMPTAADAIIPRVALRLAARADAVRVPR